MTDPFDLLEPPTCSTCGTVTEDVICATCQRNAEERRRQMRPVDSSK